MKMIKYIIISLSVLFIFAGCTEDVKSIDNQSSDTDVAGHENLITVHTRPSSLIQSIDDEEEDPALNKEVKPSNWYLRLVADDTERGLKTSVAQLGVLEGANEDVKQTLLSTGHFTGTYLDVVFVDPDGMTTGIYKTNYKQYIDGSEYRWRFTVRSDDPSADVVLSWRGLYVLSPYTDSKNRVQYTEYRSVTNPLISQMKLIDVDLGTKVVATVDNQVQKYAFNMNGKTEKVFEWVVGVVPVALKQKTSKQLKSVSVQSKKVIVKQKSVTEKSRNFDLSKPPTMEWDNGR